MFKKVTINRTDTCLTYALKRLGIYDKFPEAEGEYFMQKCDKRRIKSFEGLEPGALIMVKNPPDTIYKTFGIDEQGRLIYSGMSNRLHFMLYEGRYISDVTREDGIPFIRVRESLDFDPGGDGLKWFALTNF
jgi:hypothetical protein